MGNSRGSANSGGAEYRSPCRSLGSFDVVVVGGGSAGCSAAIAAARSGAATLLIERMGFLGGTGAAVLDTFYGFYSPGQNPRKVVGGIPDEVVERLQRRGGAIKRPNTYGAGTGITYDPELLKVAWDELVSEADVRLLLHTFFIDTLVDDGAVTGVVVANKAGVWCIRARVVVDASGDADVAFRAGVPFEGSRQAPVQALTTTFRLAGVDVERTRGVKRETLWEMMREANRTGQYRLPREEGSVHITPYPGIMATNMVRVAIEDPTDPVQLSAAEVEGRRQALEYYRFLRDKVPGFEKAVLVGLSTHIGVRESRRVRGEYWLTREDVLQARRFVDAIAMCAAPIEEHHSGRDTRWEYLPEGATYDIPYRCLVPQRVDGLLVAGRCLSASHDAHASVRSMAQCMAMGHAAGLAAAQAAGRGVPPRRVDVAALQRALVEQGAILDGVEA